MKKIESNETKKTNFDILSSFAYNSVSSTLLHPDLLMPVSKTHSHTHPHTRVHRKTTEHRHLFLSANRPVSSAVIFLGYIRKQLVILQIAPNGRIGTLAQPVSLRPPSARWAGTCTAAVGSGLTSSALLLAHVLSLASPPGRRWSAEKQSSWQTGFPSHHNPIPTAWTCPTKKVIKKQVILFVWFLL